MGFTFNAADLHPFLGMDGKQMLRRLLKKTDSKLLDHILKLQGERYRELYLPRVRVFPGVRRLFERIKAGGSKIALATSCDRDEIVHYRAAMDIDDLLDNVCCGDDVKREKPAPDVVTLAAKKLRMPPSDIVMVGDTPYDAEAARSAGVAAIGLQSGHFSRMDLLDAGCAAVFFDLQVMRQRLEDTAPGEGPTVETRTTAAAE